MNTELGEGSSAPGMADPVHRLPPPAEPGARREVSIVIAPRGSWTTGCRVRGRARDVVRVPGGSAATRGSGELAVVTDAAGVIEELLVPGAPRWAQALPGRAVRSGFRAGLADLEDLDPASPVAGLVDDLPTVRLIAGYARLMDAEGAGSPPAGTGSRRPPQLDVCSGWRADGVAVQRTLTGRPLLGAAAATPPMGSVADGAFLEEEVLAPGTMRRRRLLEVSPDGDGGWDLLAYLRDSHVDGSGTERGLHEYVVEARAGSDLVLRSVTSTPRTLPFQDCPLAALQVDRLVGMPAADAGTAVGGRLPGTAGCTHLNDLLRTFRFLPRLTALVDRGDAHGHRAGR